LAALEKARTLSADEDCDLWLLLDLTHSRLGHRDEARAWYDKAVVWKKQHPQPNWSRDRLRNEADSLLAESHPAKNQNMEERTAKPRK
jgi:hypothetical protein